MNRASDSESNASSYWTEKLAGNPPALELPASHPRTPDHHSETAVRSLELESETRREFGALLGARGIDERTGLLAAFLTLVYRSTRQSDVVVGVEHEDLVLPLRFDFSGDTRPSFVELCGRVQAELESARANAQPLLDTLCAVGLSAADELFKVALLEPGSSMGREIGGMELILRPAEALLEGELAYDGALFEESRIERMLGHFGELLAGIVASPEASVGTLPFLSAAERDEILVRWNDKVVDFPEDVCLHELF